MQTEFRTKLLAGGRLRIPVRARRALGLNIGDEVVLKIEREKLPRARMKGSAIVTLVASPESDSADDEPVDEDSRASAVIDLRLLCEPRTPERPVKL